MAHLIDTTTGEAACFVTGEPAWHRLGTVVTQAQTSEEAIKLAGLNWSVEKWPLRAEDPVEALTGIGSGVRVPERFATVRTDTRSVLGVVGRHYRPFQNAEAFEFFDSLVGEKLAMYETAGSLREGRSIWMMARVPGEYRVGDHDDTLLPYVLLTNGHDGGEALRMIPTLVRVVCWNTRTLALGQADRAKTATRKGISIPHYDSLGDKVKAARSALGIVEKRFAAEMEQAKALAAVPFSDGQAREFFELLLLPKPVDEKDAKHRPANADEKRQEMLAAWLSNWSAPRQTNHGTGGSAWAAYNSVSEWADHRTYRGRSVEARLSNQVNSVWFGDAARLKDRAWEAALTLAV